MKKLRILLSSFAIVLAVGAAFASSLTPAVTGYYYDSSSPLGPKCISSITCNNVSGPTCMSGSKVLQDSSTPVGGDCGNDLRRD